jgi:hypothetical protein
VVDSFSWRDDNCRRSTNLQICVATTCKTQRFPALHELGPGRSIWYVLRAPLATFNKGNQQASFIAEFRFLFSL